MNNNTSHIMKNMNGQMKMMTMTFNDNNNLKLLFEFWNIQNETEYVFSCFFVILFTTFTHGLKYYIKKCDKQIIELNKKLINLSHNSENVIQPLHDNENIIEFVNINNDTPKERQLIMNELNDKPSSKVSISNLYAYKLRVKHGILTSAHFGSHLIIMLIAMTYNYGLFMSILFGYFVGDVIFQIYLY